MNVTELRQLERRIAKLSNHPRLSQLRPMWWQMALAKLIAKRDAGTVQ